MRVLFSYTLPHKTVGTELPGVHRAPLLQPGLGVQMSTPKPVGAGSALLCPGTSELQSLPKLPVASCQQSSMLPLNRSLFKPPQEGQPGKLLLLPPSQNASLQSIPLVPKTSHKGKAHAPGSQSCDLDSEGQAHPLWEDPEP